MYHTEEALTGGIPDSFIHETFLSFDSCLVYRVIMHTTYIATKSSVSGIANQIESAPVTMGSRRMRIPLMTRPLDMDTMKAAFGFITAWK